MLPRSRSRGRTSRWSAGPPNRAARSSSDRPNRVLHSGGSSKSVRSTTRVTLEASSAWVNSRPVSATRRSRPGCRRWSSSPGAGPCGGSPPAGPGRPRPGRDRSRQPPPWPRPAAGPGPGRGRRAWTGWRRRPAHRQPPAGAGHRPPRPPGGQRSALRWAAADARTTIRCSCGRSPSTRPPDCTALTRRPAARSGARTPARTVGAATTSRRRPRPGPGRPRAPIGRRAAPARTLAQEREVGRPYGRQNRGTAPSRRLEADRKGRPGVGRQDGPGFLPSRSGIHRAPAST